MKKDKGYKKKPLSFNRRMVAISASVTGKKNIIHSITEVNVSKARTLIRNHKEKTGETLSFTAFIVYCLAQSIAKQPHLNAFRKGNKLIFLDDISVSVLVEREVEGEKVPEPMGIQRAQKKSFRQIHDEIREAQQQKDEQLGSLSNMSWVRFIPTFLLRSFFLLASKNIKMQKRYGVVSVTAPGMFGGNANWFVPHGGPTVLLTVGSIVNRPVLNSGIYENQEHLCLTISFDHAIVDGAPAARLTKELTEKIQSGAGLLDER